MERAKPWWLLSITLLSIIICLAVVYSPARQQQQQTDRTNESEREQEQSEQTKVADSAIGNGRTDDKNQIAEDKPDQKTKSDDANIQVQSNDPSKQTDNIAKDNQLGSSRPSKSDAFALFGMSLGDNKREFLAQHGSPQTEYFTEGDEEPLLVLQFEDFIVGFDSDGEAAFINITSSGIDVGLGGVAIGSNIDDVSIALGEADSFSTYVMTYVKNEDMLKFDIDPSTQTVTSIKLFKQSE